MPAIELNLEEEDKAYFQNHGDWEKYDPISIAHKMSCTNFKVYLLARMPILTKLAKLTTSDVEDVLLLSLRL